MLTVPLDAANAQDEVMRGLNAGSHMAESLGVEGHEVRPCIAIYFQDGCMQGLSAIGRNGACHLIAVELRRLGFGELESLPHLREWDKKNQPPLGDREIKKVISTAFRTSYKYGCRGSKVTPTCIGRDNCPYVKSGLGSYKKTVLWRDFILKGWQHVVCSPANMIYNIALPELEYRRQRSPGQPLYVNHREIKDIIGLKSHSRMGQYLIELAGFGLIKYVPGNPLKKNRKASEIIRVVPVPDVPEIYRNDSNKFR